MNRILLIISLLCSLATAPLAASAKAFCANPCCQTLPPFCGCFEAGGEALFFRPHLCDLDYALLDERPRSELPGEGASCPLPCGVQLTVPCDYDLGWRVILGYLTQDACFDLRMQYTGVHQKVSALTSTARGRLYATLGTPGTPGILKAAFESDTQEEELAAHVDMGSKLEYDAVDVEGASRKWRYRHLWTRFFLGIHVANIEHHISLAFKGHRACVDGKLQPVARIYNRRRSWGAGPRAGAEFLCPLTCGFAVSGRCAGAILTGEICGKLRQIEELEGAALPMDEVKSHLQIRDPEQGVVSPMLNTRLGLSYCRCCMGCLNVSLEFGYELITYINVISRYSYCGRKVSASATCQSFTIDGFYLSLLVQI